MFLYHYYDKNIGPFKNLSDLPIEEANKVLKEIAITNPNAYCAKRNVDYMQARIYYENILRNEFQRKGGLICRQVPHYMVVEHSPWLSTWYDNSSYIKIPIEMFNIKTISFTYGGVKGSITNIFILSPFCIIVGLCKWFFGTLWMW